MERAVSGSGQERFFEAGSYIAFLFHLFVLQVNHSYYREALDTAYDLADLEGTSDLMGQINPTIEQIKSLRLNDSLIFTKGAINNINGWSIGLVKNTFLFSEVEGEIDELKLRCSKKYVFLEYLEDKIYQIPKSYGWCDLSVIGTPETQFELVQQPVTVK